MKVMIGLAAVLLAGSTAACTPVEGRVTLAGDSVTLTALLYSEQDGITTTAHGWDNAEKVGLGWKAIHAQPRLEQDVAGATTSPEVHVMAFGHNYVPWSADYENELLVHVVTPAEGACTVVVKPYYGGTDTTHKAAIVAYRNWADRIALALPDRVVTVDATSALAGHLGPDGVHLIEGDGATGAAFLAVAESGIEKCEAL